MYWKINIHEFASSQESKLCLEVEKSNCLANNEELNQALYLWFVQKCVIGMPISGTFCVIKLSSSTNSYVYTRTRSNYHIVHGEFWLVMAFL